LTVGPENSIEYSGAESTGPNEALSTSGKDDVARVALECSFSDFCNGRWRGATEAFVFELAGRIVKILEELTLRRTWAEHDHINANGMQFTS